MVMGKSGNMRHLESEGPELIQVHSKCFAWFVRAGWDAFCLEFKGSQYGVARDFVERFNDIIAQLGDLTL